MRHLALFNGIGGFQLAAKWMGWQNAASVEIDPFCNQVTKYHFPDCKQYLDINDFNENEAEKYAGLIDIISGGFPCQPFSLAGTQSGKEHNSYLWPQTIGTIKKVKPLVCVLENVFGLSGILEPAGLSDLEREAAKLLSEGYIQSPFSARGDKMEAAFTIVQERIMGQIIKDLYAAGYVLPEYSDGTPIVYLVPACAVNAPHERYRVWIVAYRSGGGRREPELRQSNEFAAEGFKSRHTTNAFTTHTESERGGRLPIRTIENNAIAGINVGNEYVTHTQRQGLQKPEQSEQRIELLDAERNDSQVNADTGSAGREEYNASDIADRQRFGSGMGSFECADWRNFPTQPPICGRNDGFSGRLAGITFPKWRSESIKAFGNAIVPQVALEIFKAIEQTICQQN